MNMTVGELRDRLKGYSDETEITFGSNIFGVPIIFYRFKRRGENLLQIELSEDYTVKGVYSLEFDGSSWLITSAPNIKGK